MKIQSKKLLALALCLSIALSACTASPGSDSKETPAPTPISSVDTTGADPQTFVITLLEGQTTAIVNGTEAQLSAAPFLQNGSFYYPLADVVQLIGGGFSQEGDTATIQLFGTTVTYTAGNPDVTVNGTSYRNDHRLLRFAQTSDEETGAASPLLIDGTFLSPTTSAPATVPILGSM